MTTASSATARRSRARWRGADRSRSCWATRVAATAGLSPAEAVDAVVAHYYHPAGTCAVGTVVDERLRVYGVDGLFVADCSVFPTVPRANTCMPAVLVAHRLADWL